jgi:hypothetical protein
MKQQLLLGSMRTLNETLRQILQMEITKLIVGSSIRLWKMSMRTLWRSQPPPKQKIRLLTAYMLVLQVHRPLWRVLSPQTERRKGNMPVGYSG